MCGRYVSPADAAIERAFRVDRRSPSPFGARYNVAPTTLVPILRVAEDGAWELLQARWGLIPRWWNKPRPPALSFNARSEEAFDKPMWRDALRHVRCLMPALGWYEWQERDAATGAALDERPPHYFHAGDEAPIAFAGLLSWWPHPEGEPIPTCALMSAAAAPGLADVHDRMPVVLDPRAYESWLDRSLTDPAAIRALIAGARTEFLHHPVDAAVNQARNDGPELIRPAPVATPRQRLLL